MQDRAKRRVETRASGGKREKEAWKQTIIETEKERTSKGKRGPGRQTVRRRGTGERGREKDVTRGITWCIDRRAASTRAIPAANLPTYPKHYPLSLIRHPPPHPLSSRPPFSPPTSSCFPSSLHTCSCNKPTPRPSIRPSARHQPPAKPRQTSIVVYPAS